MVPGWFQFHIEPQVPFADSIVISHAIIVGRMPYAGVWPLGCSQIPQNSFIFTSDNSEMLIIWHLGKVVQRPEVLLFSRKSSISETDRSQDYIQKASKSVCTSTVMVPPDPLSPTPSTSSAVKTQEDTTEDLNDPEPAAEGNAPLISLATQV